MSKNKIAALPLIPLRGITVFPNMVASFAVGRQKSAEALEHAMSSDEVIFLVSQKDARTANPLPDELYKIGTVSRVKQVLKMPGNMVHVIVEGLYRSRILFITDDNGYLLADAERIEYDGACKINNDVEAMMRLAAEAFEEYSKITLKSIAGDGASNTLLSSTPGQVADIIASGVDFSVEQKQKILETINPVERLAVTIDLLYNELNIAKLKKKIEEKVKKRMDEAQKEYYLREQLRVIQEELGDKDGIEAERAKFTKMLEEKKLPEEARAALEKEISVLSKMSPSSPDANVHRNYIEYVLSLPWTEKTEESFDIRKAKFILDKDHYGMKDVKERIIEYLAVRQNVQLTKAPILCFVGPPGVGKTSIAKSVASALGRNYVRMSLGGVKDESEIRGHRKTYIGAMPGRIISAMRSAKTINPLILLDEVDKLSSSFNGDPASALLEVLDSEQNYAFRDHYVEVGYNLSQALFICTANSLDGIPKALKDRMEIIPLSSYTADEKMHIAQKHLYPKQLAEHGLSKTELQISKKAIEAIISGYTHESGVRQLERVLGKICRKTVTLIAEKKAAKLSVTEKNLEELIGKPKYNYIKKAEAPEAGVVRGLAWTEAGGDTLSVEVNTMAGTGKFELTGNMGDVMKESAMAAVSYIRSKANHLNLPESFYKDRDIHIHIPEGAVPKDGPSAGITMATAMVSALTGVPADNNVAMTGEITIRGRVLPIGGLKEKVIAAKRAGIGNVILPYANKKDLDEIPEEIKSGMDFVLVKEMDEVLRSAMVKGKSVWK